MNGIYIHVPFCVKKCAYCDFYSVAYSVTDTRLMDDYVTALTQEMAIYSDNGIVDTIYFGGGTPSLLTQAHLETIMEKIHTLYRITPDAEISFEVNPGTVTASSLTVFKATGINRLSIGVQSFQDEHLGFLGRIHNADQARCLIDDAGKAGFHNLSIDLIYGLPGQDEGNWLKDLKTALEYTPAHLSCYTLSYEEKTPLHTALINGEFMAQNDEIVARLFTRTMEILAENGYVHYEISNFARSENAISRHNKKYWDFKPYRGFGPSAHSYLPQKNKRYWNVRDINTYIRHLNKGHVPVDGSEILDKSQQITEAIFLGLRKGEGICLSSFKKAFGMDFLSRFEGPLHTLSIQNLIHIAEDTVCLTRKGFLFADRISSMLIDMVDC